jgi:hypothetical protein
MEGWYKNDRRRFEVERRALSEACPLMQLIFAQPRFKLNDICKLKQEHAVAHGTHCLSFPDGGNEIEYKIAIVTPADYPKRYPDLVCNDRKLPIGNLNRHIMSDGQACLGVSADIGMRWTANLTIVDFLHDFVSPFLVWQAYFDAYGHPPWGERSHGDKGIFEFYAETIGVQEESSILGFMQLLSRKNNPKGHELCPCNSGKRLRDCHRDLVHELRRRLSWKNVNRDLDFVKKLEADANTSGLHS